MTDEEITKELMDFAPINLLTKEQLEKARKMKKWDAIFYIDYIISDGKKIAKTYYDLYVDENRNDTGRNNFDGERTV